MAQAQGSESRLVIMPEDTFNTTPTLLIHGCEAAWDELVDGDVTATADATIYKRGTKSCKLVVAVGASAGDILATDSMTAVDISSYKYLSFFIRSSVALSSGDLQILLDNTAECASPIETLDVPAVATTGVWQYCRVALAAAASCTAIISIGVKMVVDKGAFTVYFDNFKMLNEIGQYIAFTSESLRMSRELIRSNIIRSSRNPNAPSRGNIEIGGDISTELEPYQSTLLKHLFGGVSTVGTTHTFTIDSLPEGLSIEKQFADIERYILYTGCKVNSLRISCKASGLIDTVYTIVGAEEQTSTDYIILDYEPTDWGHTPFDAFEATIEEGGSSLANVTEITLEVTNNLDGSVYCIGGDGVRQSIPAGVVAVSGKLTAMFEDVTLYTKALNHTETSLLLTFTKGDGGGTAGNESLSFEIEELIFKPAAPVITGPNGVLVELEYEGYYSNGANASAIQAVLKNTQTAVL